MTALDWSIILPEAGLAIYALAALMVGAFGGKDDLAPVILWATVAALLVAAGVIGLARPPVPVGEPGSAFFGMFVDDAFARFAKITVLLAAASVLAMSADWLTRQRMMRFELPILVTLSVIGMMLMTSANDLIILYMGLELQSLALYVLAASRRDSERSSEAGLKYFVLGSLSSGLMLYGASLVYGFSGTTGFEGIVGIVGAGDMPVGLLFGLVFVMTGLAFKVSAVPFHMWTPDVYEGAPTPVTAFFATAPKVAAMALLARLLFGAFGSIPADWSQIVVVLSLLSMVLGSIAGIGQRDIKRLMAYSSIAHMGFALMGLAAATAAGVEAMLIYMAIYALMNVGTFAFILSMERDGRPVSEIASLNQLAARAPGAALALLVLLFSLAGVPPMLGFFAKLSVLSAAVQADMAWLAVAGVIASVIGAYYYIRIVYLMYFGAETNPASIRSAAVPSLLLTATAAATLFGAVSMLGVDRAAAIASEALVAHVPAKADAATLAVATAPVD